MLYAIVLVVITTALPLVIAVVGTSFAYSEYKDGFFSVVGEALVGKWLGVYIVFASVLSSVGMFESEMSSDAFMLMGLAERGHIPAIFAKRSAYGTPTAAICFSAMGILVLSSFSFLEIGRLLVLIVGVYVIGRTGVEALFCWDFLVFFLIKTHTHVHFLKPYTHPPTHTQPPTQSKFSTSCTCWRCSSNSLPLSGSGSSVLTFIVLFAFL